MTTEEIGNRLYEVVMELNDTHDAKLYSEASYLIAKAEVETEYRFNGNEARNIAFNTFMNYYSPDAVHKVMMEVFTNILEG